jgi:ketosteroid isomerase-like protein
LVASAGGVGLMAESGRHVEIVRRVFEASREAYLSGERAPFEAAVREAYSPDAVIVPSSALASGSAGPYYGREGVVGQQDAVAARWPDFELIPEEYVDVPPDTVVVLGKVAARRGKGSGYAVEIGCVIRFEDGLIVSLHSYEGRRRALEAAGVTESAAPDRSE